MGTELGRDQGKRAAPGGRGDADRRARRPRSGLDADDRPDSSDRAMNRARVRSSRHLRSILIMVCLWGALPTLASANAVKLFDAVRVTNVGTVTEPHMAVPFAQTQLLLICPPHPAAIISSDVDGTAGIVVDNFITVDGVNVCPIAAEGGYRNCFQRFNGGSSD